MWALSGMQAPLTHRESEILRAAVEEFIATAEPIGSRILTQRRGLPMSPATVRNVMADLERLGLLGHPHTSAGRVPTARGYRVYLDSLLPRRRLTPHERLEVRSRLDLDDADPATAADHLSRALSALSGQAAVVVMPRFESLVFKRIELFPVGPGRLVGVFISSSNLTFQRVVHVDADVGAAEIEFFHKYLNDLLDGLSLAGVRRRILEEMQHERALYDRLATAALKLGEQVVRPAAPADAVAVDGQRNLLDHPEFNDVTHIKAVLHALEQRARLVEILDQVATGDGVQVVLGAETAAVDFNSCGIIATNCGNGEHGACGAMAVIGPMRMDYSKLIPMVAYAASLVTDRLARL
jgi:heat-inducible transcriptional repressor